MLFRVHGREWVDKDFIDAFVSSYSSSFYVINCGKAVCKPNYILNALTEHVEQEIQACILQ